MLVVMHVLLSRSGPLELQPKYSIAAELQGAELQTAYIQT